jgi:hypothetical protein
MGRSGTKCRMPGVGFAEEAAEDFDASVDQLRAAIDHGGRRRAIKAILEEVYRLREHRVRQVGSIDAYQLMARQHRAGRTVEGLSAVRTVPAHFVAELVTVIPEMRALYPSEDLFPSEDLYPGSNLKWLETGAMSTAPSVLTRTATSERDTSPYYDSDVAGRPVYQTMEDARSWLVTDVYLGSL